MKWLIWFLFVISLLALSEKNFGTFSIISHYVFFDIDSSANGIIIRSDRSKIGVRVRQLGYEIEYKYIVNGDEYVGSLVNYKGVLEDASAVLEKYPLERKVIVYYDSSAPSQAVLEKSSMGFGIWGQLFVLFICVPLITLISFKYVFR